MKIVFFCKREAPRTKPHHWLVCDDFVHCFIAEQVTGGVLWTSLTCDGLKFEIVDTTIEEFIKANFELCSAILAVEKREKNSYHGLITCVTYVKSLLGVNKWWIQRPKELYRELLKWDSLVIKPYSPWLTDKHK